MTIILVIVVVAALILAAVLGVGVIVLMKMGVIAKYAFKEEPQDQGDYEIDQSREAK
jgi:hypothetical protein